MNISILAPSWKYGLRYWRPWFQSASHSQMHVRFFTGEIPESDNDLVVKVPSLRIPSNTEDIYNSRTLYLVSPMIVKAVCKSDPDIVICVEYSTTTALGILAAKFSRAKVLIFQENHATLSWSKKRWRQLLLHFVDGVIANTDSARKQLVDMTPAKFILRIDMLVPPNSDRTSFPVTEGLSTRFLFAGRLVSAKNPEILIDAAAILHEEGIDLQLIYCGDGDLRPTLEAKVDSLGLSDCVSFLGEVPYHSMNGIYANCDVFVLPSLGDYRSMAVLEAMRLGKPIITSQYDGNAGESVIDGWNGYVVDPTDLADVTMAMRRLANVQRGLAMGQRSSLYMRDKTIDNSVKSFFEAAMTLGL